MTWDHIILLFLTASLALPASLLAAPAAAPVGAPGSLPLLPGCLLYLGERHPRRVRVAHTAEG
jgi:hypothetical protein